MPSHTIDKTSLKTSLTTSLTTSGRYAAFAACLALAPSCGGSETIHVRSGEAELPVFVQNPDRTVLLVFETGGPSGTAIDGVLAGYYPWTDCFGDDVSVASYDRRGTGNARGLSRDAPIRLEDYVTDLRAVTRALETRYEPERVIWMGHSWGVSLTMRALADDPARVDGMIAIDGAWLGKDEDYVPWRYDFACRVADEQLAAGDDDALWPEIAAFCEQHARDGIEYESAAFDELWGFLHAIYERFDDGFPLETAGILRALFFSHYDPLESHVHSDRIGAALHEQGRDRPVLDRLGEVTTPTLILNGEFDDLIPTELAAEAHARLATPEAEKSLVELAGGGHAPFVSQKDRFCGAAREFIAARR